MIGLRFKLNNNDMIRPEQSLFYNFGITNPNKQKTTNLLNYNYNSLNTTGSYSNIFFNKTLINIFTSNSFDTSKINNYWPVYINEVFNLVYNISLLPIINIFNLPNQLLNIISQNFNFLIYKLTSYSFYFGHKNTNSKTILYTTEDLNHTNLNNSINTIFNETSNSIRYNKFNNALVGYDYKSGHYLGI
jgi:hypothetical protein